MNPPISIYNTASSIITGRLVRSKRLKPRIKPRRGISVFKRGTSFSGKSFNFKRCSRNNPGLRIFKKAVAMK